MTPATAPDWATQHGWLVDLPDPGERVNIDPLVQLGFLSIPSNVPTSDTCTAGGYAWFNFFDLATGGYVPAPGNTTASTKVPDALLVGQSLVCGPGSNCEIHRDRQHGHAAREAAADRAGRLHGTAGDVAGADRRSMTLALPGARLPTAFAASLAIHAALAAALAAVAAGWLPGSRAYRREAGGALLATLRAQRAAPVKPARATPSRARSWCCDQGAALPKPYYYRASELTERAARPRGDRAQLSERRARHRTREDAPVHQRTRLGGRRRHHRSRAGRRVRAGGRARPSARRASGRATRTARQ